MFGRLGDNNDLWRHMHPPHFRRSQLGVVDQQLVSRIKLHLHVPRLETFSLYAACDEIVTGGLSKTMPYVIYLKTIMAFAEKHGNDLSVMKMYLAMRRKLAISGAEKLVVATLICALGHIVLGDDDVDKQLQDITPLLQRLIELSDDDVDGVIGCIQNYASRCTTLGKVELLYRSMCVMLKQVPCKSIREVLIYHGGHLSDNLEAAVGCGMHDMLQAARDVHRGPRGLNVMIRAIESGDIDTVQLFLGNRSVLQPDDVINGRDLSVPVCALLLSYCITRPGMQHHYEYMRSVSLLKWQYDHQLINISEVLLRVARDAAYRGGVYVDVLHYLVDQLQIPIPCDILFTFDHAVDLSVIDYLLIHGADMHAVRQLPSLVSDFEEHLAPIVLNPLYVRYWLDKGMKYRHPCKFLLFFVEKCLGSPLCLTFIKNHISAADINQYRGDEKRTVLHDVCRLNDRQSELVEMLITHGADVNERDRTKRTPLHYACSVKDCCPDVVRVLLRHGADVNAVGGGGDRPLLCAWILAKISVVELLLNRDDVDTSAVDGGGNSSLHYACKRNSFELVELLLMLGVNVNPQNSDGCIPLHYACQYGSVAMVEMLITHGAIMNYEDKQGKTPMCYARNDDIKSMLKRFGYVPRRTDV